MPEAEIAKAAQLLDLMLEHFADDGHWTRGRYDDGNGGRCLVGALLHLSRKHGLPRAPAIALLQDAMPRPGLPLVHFNDACCGSLAELNRPRRRRAWRGAAALRPGLCGAQQVDQRLFLLVGEVECHHSAAAAGRVRRNTASAAAICSGCWEACSISPKPRLAIGCVVDDKVGAGIVPAASVALAARPRADFNRHRVKRRAMGTPDRHAKFPAD